MVDTRVFGRDVDDRLIKECELSRFAGLLDGLYHFTILCITVFSMF